jgi:Tfp pilus assembly protein PilX
MISGPGPLLSNRRRGVALVIVLAFVALLTVLAVAFFSRAITVQQISNSSANKTMVDDFAGAAIATLIGDLKQEIAAGSTVSSPAANVFVYAPTSPQTFVPEISGFTPAYSAGQETDGLANLVKVSAAQKPFYQGSNYNTSAYPPPGDATVPVGTRSRAMGPDTYTSTTLPSQNGRVITTARWNKGLLLAKQTVASDTDFTPISNYTAPDWIVVAKDGSNPATWPASGGSALTVGGANQAIGRYAYNIYDEGGLLDVNAAGYPDLTGFSVSPQATYPAYKKSLAYADLTQLLGITSGTDPAGRPITGLPTARQVQVIQTLVGWRNYASSGIDVTQNPPLAGSPVTGSANVLPGYTWTNNGTNNNNILNILNFSELNGVGFLHAANPLLVNGQSDRLFTSRQQLLGLLLNSVADQSTTPAAAAERAALQNAMQYLGTFSRGLEQPSVIPANTVAGAPLLVSIPNGGNDGYDPTDPIGTEKKINPDFLVDASLRVPTSKALGRNDGTDLVAGEPLVKRRFALNYLAWLTYRGPSSTRTLTNPAATGSDADIYGLENTYGFSSAFLQQGTDNGSMTTNIPKYFGLTWDTTNHLWKYIDYLGGSTSGSIMTLKDVALAGREANFFELLKAAITVGSLGKAYAYSTTANGGTPAGYAELFDNSVDAQVMQIGANIIDQFDLDGYPTRIQFNSGLMGSVQEYDGVEDLPYLYRVREGKIMITDSTPAESSLPMVGTPPNFAPGSGVVLQEPEIWNPHAWSATLPDTNPRPTSFQLLAASATPAGSGSAVQPGVEWRFYTGSPGTATGTSAAAQINTSLSFSIPQGRLDLFREPTLLIKPNVPAGCFLGGGTPITSLYPAVQYAANLVTDNKSYLGIVMGTVPMAWEGTIPQAGIDGVANPPAATAGVIPAGYAYYPTAPNITYRMQYQDPWSMYQTYDLKFAPVANATSYNTPDKSGATANRTFDNTPNNGTYMKTSAANIIGSEMSVMCFDPRSRRFGMEFAGTNGRGSMSQTFPLGSSVGYNEDNRNYVNRFGWAGAPAAMTNSTMQASAAQNALMTTRPDEYQGMVFSNYNAGITYYGISSGPTAAGWLPSGVNAIISPGLFSQNNPDTAAATSPYYRYNPLYDGSPTVATTAQYFADADNVVRRGMSAYVPIGGTVPASPPAAGLPSGLPTKPADAYSAAGVATANADTYSRPIMLNRPFQSPAELGYVFSGTPWRNLDFASPESGSAPLLDLFCVSVNTDANGLSAGKVNLNTRQRPVLQAVLAGAYRDRFSPTSSSLSTGNPLSGGAVGEASRIAALVTARTTSPSANLGPLRNVSELVGIWKNSVATGSAIDGHKSYGGFIDDWAKSANSNDSDKRLQSFREAPVRALAASGQTRVWNLLIDVIAQTGKYPPSAVTPNQFVVEGEQRYWVHVAIDRLTGQVIDKQVEVVKE